MEWLDNNYLGTRQNTNQRYVHALFRLIRYRMPSHSNILHPFYGLLYGNCWKWLEINYVGTPHKINVHAVFRKPGIECCLLHQNDHQGCSMEMAGNSTLLESHPCFEVGTATRRRTIIKHLAHPPLSTLEREILTRKNSKDGND